MKKRIGALLLTLAMVAAYMPMMAVTSFAKDEIEVTIDLNGGTYTDGTLEPGKNYVKVKEGPEAGVWKVKLNSNNIAVSSLVPAKAPAAPTGKEFDKWQFKLGGPDAPYVDDYSKIELKKEVGKNRGTFKPIWKDAVIELTVTGLTVKSKVYDGKTDAELEGEMTVAGKIDGDNVSVSVKSATFEDANVENNKKVTVCFELTGEDKAKYSISDSELEGTITAKPITIKANDASKYCGEEEPTLDYSLIDSELVEGDELEGVSVSRDEGTAAGTYDITVSHDDTKDTNYAVTCDNPAKFEIKHKVAKFVLGGMLDGDCILAECSCTNEKGEPHVMAVIGIMANGKPEDGTPADVHINDASDEDPDLDGDWTTVTGQELPEIVYKDRATDRVLAEAPTLAGEYRAEITAQFGEDEAVTAGMNYEITEAEEPIIEEDDDDDVDGVKTGDANNLMIYLMMSVAAMAGAAYVYKRKED